MYYIIYSAGVDKKFQDKKNRMQNASCLNMFYTFLAKYKGPCL